MKFKVTTQKLLVTFDSKNPSQLTDDFLVVVLESAQPKLLGVRTKKIATSGLMIYVGQEITVNDLFKELVDTGRKIESVEQTLRVLENYIQKLQEFRIGNLLNVEADEASGFKLVKLADSPPTTNVNKLPWPNRPSRTTDE
ncbi:MAG: hypothetical protein HOP33_12155 [Verrucomicrobia bacterium]|nr:hypothetical protein [Verrucomicrobiota bacterium]